MNTVEYITERVHEAIQWRRQSTGFLTDKGTLWSRREGHAAGIGIGIGVAAHMLPPEAAAGIYAAIKAGDLTGTLRDSGHVRDAVQELAYVGPTALLTYLVMATL